MTGTLGPGAVVAGAVVGAGEGWGAAGLGGATVDGFSMVGPAGEVVSDDGVSVVAGASPRRVIL